MSKACMLSTTGRCPRSAPWSFSLTRSNRASTRSSPSPSTCARMTRNRSSWAPPSTERRGPPELWRSQSPRTRRSYGPGCVWSRTHSSCARFAILIRRCCKVRPRCIFNAMQICCLASTSTISRQRTQRAWRNQPSACC